MSDLRAGGAFGWGRSRALGLAVWLGLAGSVPFSLAATAKDPPVGPGLEYVHQRLGDIPWSIHTLKIERTRADFKLISTLAGGTVAGLSTVAEQIQALPADLGEPAAAINGDFFVIASGPYQGDPRGLQILQGELVSAPNGGPCFWIDAAGNFQMDEVKSELKVTGPEGTPIPVGLNQERADDAAVLYTPRLDSSTRTKGGKEWVLWPQEGGRFPPLRAGQGFAARILDGPKTGDAPLAPGTLVLSVGPQRSGPWSAMVPGALLQISTATLPDLSGVDTALGGGPVLIRDGNPGAWEPPQPRHPRTAVGWTATHLYWVVVDGRQNQLSVGMTFPELAAHLAGLGCQQALNLDGGGSSTLWLGGQVVNSPSDGQARRVANGLILLRRAR